MHDHDAVLERAHGLMARGAWSEALEQLRQAEDPHRIDPATQEALARAAYGAGCLETAFGAWEHVYRFQARAGDMPAAADAAVTIAMHLMIDTGLMAPVRGWLATADRCLRDREPTGTHAWIAAVRAYERLMCGDMASAGTCGAEAAFTGERHGDATVAALGRIVQARATIFEGGVAEGLTLIDEAAVSMLSGDSDPLVAGIIYCEVVCALQGLAQYDRARDWTEAMERWRGAHAFGGLHGRCRVHRAELLRLSGPYDDAETEALHACDELRPWMRREFGWPLTELGTIRLRRGDLAGAEEALLAAHAHGWDPNPSLARVRLAEGDVAAAHAMIAESLTHPGRAPSKERPPGMPLTRAPLLDAQAEIAVAAKDPQTAANAADELEQIAATYGGPGLRAAAMLAHGRAHLSRGEHDGAVAACEQAVTWWSEVGAPYEIADARLVLSEAQRAVGNEDRARMELAAAAETFARIGADGKARQACDALSGSSPTRAATATRATPLRGVFRRDGDTRYVELDGEAVQIRDLKGMRYLERLLADPEREFHVLDLVAMEEGVLPAAAGVSEQLEATRSDDLGPRLDRRAVEACRQRLAEIDDDIEEARLMGDPERAALAKADRDYLVQELSGAFGLGGRARPVGATAERARTSVSRSLRYALRRIEHHHPLAGAHLQQAVRTGTYCSYRPDPAVAVEWHP